MRRAKLSPCARARWLAASSAARRGGRKKASCGFHSSRAAAAETRRASPLEEPFSPRREARRSRDGVFEFSWPPPWQVHGPRGNVDTSKKTQSSRATRMIKEAWLRRWTGKDGTGSSGLKQAALPSLKRRRDPDARALQTRTLRGTAIDGGGGGAAPRRSAAAQPRDP